MGALEEASQRHVQGFGIKISSFPSPGSSPTATRTTVNMLLTVLAITREVTSDRSILTPSSWQAVSMASPRGHLWAALKTAVFWWWQKHWHASVRSRHPMHDSGTLLGQGWKWGTAWGRGGGGLPENDASSPVVQLGLKEQGTPPKDEHSWCQSSSHYRKFSLLSFFTPAISLLLSLGHRFSFFLFLTRYSSVLHWSPSHLLSWSLNSINQVQWQYKAGHHGHLPKVLTGKMDDRHKLAVPLTFLLLSVPFEIPFKILNAQSRSSPSIHICLYIEILP